MRPARQQSADGGGSKLWVDRFAFVSGREFKPDMAAAFVDAPAVGERRDDQQPLLPDLVDAVVSDATGKPAALVDDRTEHAPVVDADTQFDLTGAVQRRVRRQLRNDHQQIVQLLRRQLTTGTPCLRDVTRERRSIQPTWHPHR